MKRLKWQKKFRDLPEIPISKRWLKDYSSTLERSVMNKLFFGDDLSVEDIDILNELDSYYKNLYISLENLDYTTFNQNDFKNFKNYIFYAFNYIVLLSNDLTISQTYRIVINEHLTGVKKSLLKKGLLTYPPQHIVKKINKYNRANTSNTTVFYGSETIDTALNEMKPKIGDLVTIGVWKPNRKNGTYISYPISHSAQGFGVNEHSTGAFNAIQEFKKKNKQWDLLEHYFHLLGREFSKPINHHYEYLISSMFSEKILDNEKRENTDFDFECIIYPSVGNKFHTSNLAIRKDILRHTFDLVKVIEFEVTNTHYDKNQSKNTEEINLVDFKNYKETMNFEENNIIW